MEIYEEPEFTEEQKRRAKQLFNLLKLEADEKQSKEKKIQIILACMYLE